METIIQISLAWIVILLLVAFIIGMMIGVSIVRHPY